LGRTDRRTRGLRGLPGHGVLPETFGGWWVAARYAAVTVPDATTPVWSWEVMRSSHGRVTITNRRRFLPVTSGVAAVSPVIMGNGQPPRGGQAVGEDAPVLAGGGRAHAWRRVHTLDPARRVPTRRVGVGACPPRPGEPALERP